MLNACIPQPVSQLFTDNIGLFCTREVTGSLLDWGEKQPLQHVPVNPQLLCFFFSLDHSPIQQSIKKLVDVLYSSHYLSQGVSAGTKASATRSFKRYLLLWLHPSIPAIGRNVQNHCHFTQAVFGFTSAANSLTGNSQKLGQVILPALPAQHPPKASPAHKPHRKLPETHSWSQLPSILSLECSPRSTHHCQSSAASLLKSTSNSFCCSLDQMHRHISVSLSLSA